MLEAYDDLWNGDLDKIQNMPVESFLPILILRYVGAFAKEQTFAESGIEYGFDPEMIYSKWRP